MGGPAQAEYFRPGLGSLVCGGVFLKRKIVGAVVETDHEDGEGARMAPS